MTVDDQAAADAVSAMPTATDEQKIAALREYSKLTDTQKALVSLEVRVALGVASTEEQEAVTLANQIKALDNEPTDAQLLPILKAFAALTDEQEELVRTLVGDKAALLD